MTIRDKLIDEFETEREGDEERIRQEELLQQQQAQEASTSTEKAPEDYNLGDNVKELGGAIVGGGIDIYNSVGSLPKLFDKRFYQPTNP